MNKTSTRRVIITDSRAAKVQKSGGGRRERATEGHDGLGCGDGVSLPTRDGSGVPQKFFVKLYQNSAFSWHLRKFCWPNLRAVVTLSLLRSVAWMRTMIYLTNHGTLCVGHKKYAGDFRSAAGEREMGPLCGSLPRDAGDLADLKQTRRYTMLAQPGASIPPNTLEQGPPALPLSPLLPPFSPLPSLPLPSLPLEVGPFIAARRSGGAL